MNIFDISEWIGIYVVSNKIGLYSSLLAVTIILIWEIVIAQYTTTYFSKILKVIYLYTNLLFLAIHPTVIIVILFAAWNPQTFDIIYLNHLNVNFYGLIYVTVILFLPFVMLFFKSLDIMGMHQDWDKHKKIYILDKVNSYMLEVFLPIILKAVPFFLFLSIAIEGIVFVPFIFQGSDAVTIGSVLYSSLTEERYSESIANIFMIILFIKAVIYSLISLGLSKGEKRVINFITKIFIKNNFWGIIIKKGFLLIYTLFLFVGGILFILSFLMFVLTAFTLLYKLTSIIPLFFTENSISNLMDTFISTSVNGISVLGNLFNSFVYVAIASIGALIVYITFVGIAGYKDNWNIDKNTINLVNAASLFAVIPFSIVCYISIYLYAWNEFITLIILSIIYGTIYTFFSFRFGFANQIFLFELKRKSLSLVPFPYWKKLISEKILYGQVVMIFIWIFFILWNDIAIQIFAKDFQGFVKILMTLGKSGMSLDEVVAISIFQLIIALIFIPILSFIIRKAI